MPPAIRTIGRPTGDALEDARRLERSRWWRVVDAYAVLAAIPLDDALDLELFRRHVRLVCDRWADALRELDALQFGITKSCGGVEGHATRATLSLGRQFARVSGGEIAPAGNRPPPEVIPATGQSVFEAGPQDLTPRRPVAGIPSKGTDHAQ